MKAAQTAVPIDSSALITDHTAPNDRTCQKRSSFELSDICHKQARLDSRDEPAQSEESGDEQKKNSHQFTLLVSTKVVNPIASENTSTAETNPILNGTEHSPADSTCQKRPLLDSSESHQKQPRLDSPDDPAQRDKTGEEQIKRQISFMSQ